MIQFVATRLSKSVCERCPEQEFTERCPERCHFVIKVTHKLASNVKMHRFIRCIFFLKLSMDVPSIPYCATLL